jgi:hypothetical protein
VGDAVEVGFAQLIAHSQRRPGDLHRRAAAEVGRQRDPRGIALPTTRYITSDVQRFLRLRPAARPKRPSAARAHADGSGSDSRRTEDSAGAQC